MKNPAKITRPNPEGLFPRKRLFRSLDQARTRPVVFITAPPGSGKTSLVTSYIQDRKLPCLWYQADEGDADPANFFYYMGLAARKAAPRTKRPLPLFTPEYGFGVPTFTRRFFEDLCSRLKQAYVVVFDNYQEIPLESAIHEIIRTGLSTFPKQIFPMIISRSEPPAAFAAMDAGNKLHVIGWDDLRLTSGESKGIAKVLGVGRSGPKFYERLHEKADGWVAGLVLLTRAVKSKDINLESFNDLAPERVFDYFSSELFDRFAPSLQEFLLQTAWVPKMTPKMAEVLTGNKAAGRILSDLNKRNYFTEKRTSPELIYQYHPMFREFLMARAALRLPPGELAGLQVEAAKALEGAGQAEDAAERYVQAGAWKGLMELILANAPGFIRAGRYKILEKWIAALPEEKLKSNPWMHYWMGTCRLPSNPMESRTFLERAFDLFVSSGDEAGAFLSWSGAVQTFLYVFDDFNPLDRWIAWLDERGGKGSFFPSDEIALIVAAGMTAALTWRNPLHPDTQPWAEKAVSLSKNSSNIEAITRAYTNSAVYAIWMGAFDECGMLIKEMKKMAASQQVSPLRSLVLKHTEAMFYNASADYRHQALRSVTEGLEEAQKTGVHVIDPLLFNQGVVSSLNEGNYGLAGEFLLKLERTLRSSSRTHVSHHLYLSACHALCEGKIPQAVLLAKKSLSLVLETGVPVSEVLARLALFHALHEAREEDEANRELAEAQRAVDKTGSSYFEYLYDLTEAHFQFLRKNETAGLESLQKAMRLGRQKGFTTLLYFWRPGIMSHLCGKALEAGIETGYAQNLIRKLNLSPDEESMEIENWPWPLRIFTLGLFGIEKDGMMLQYPVRAPRVPLALLKAVIAFGAGGTKEEQLSDALWPETGGDTVHQTFKTNMHRLRQLIGDERALVIRDGRVTLDRQYCWVDAYAFESLLEKAGRLLREHQKGDSLIEGERLAEKALSLYNGPFLGEEANPPWSIAFQERLRSKFIRGVGNLGNHFERTRQWDRAVECYRKGLETDELAEEFYQRLMISYLSLGRKAEAIAVYNRCRKILQSALGVDPSPGTVAIYQAIQQNH